MTVFFHGNFGLDRPRMAQLLELALAKPKYGDKDLAKPFGYGAPFASTYRSWLHKSGLTNLRRPVGLTNLGEVVLQHDQNLSAIPTLWFMHHQLTTYPDRAEAWNFFIHEFRPANRSFSKEDLRAGLIKRLSPHHMKHFGEGSTMIPIIVRKIIECYTSPKALGHLGLLTKDNFGNYLFPNIEIPSICEDVSALTASYFKDA